LPEEFLGIKCCHWGSYGLPPARALGQILCRNGDS
jgi:hypothetical protein